MNVTVDDLRDAASRLRDLLGAYEQFVDGWPYDHSPLPHRVEAYRSGRDAGRVESPTDVGAALAADVVEQYYRARELESAYVQQTRARGRTDWTRIVAETAPVRQAAQRVHAAGYGIDRETGDPGYLLPAELCPARRVSMNAGSSPVVYEDRVAQYRAVTDRFSISPDVVYHPGSGHDVSPSEAFPDSRVVYTDVDAAAMAELRRASYDAHGADAVGYELDERADLIVFRNAGLFEEAVVATNLRRGGWVVANDHLESARHVSRLDGVDLVAVVPAEWDGASPRIDTVESRDSEVPSSRSERTDARDDSRRTALPPADEVPAPLRAGSPLDLYVFRYEA
ncbi:uncharacterized protein HHUB_4207 (plasmid) [Halobacterium hubeiense]|uniref:Uncharacterized protein n=1 Tax=Halobacterium hubeiense TaxID=1407499 RepID=A0A0U5AJS1_9EURY|nr:hypothetical protein [Halobacterium hubeiense]CQH63857.1 uncharacterized protein HHUB_4207 [Halobacterium hubeiense]